MRAFVIAMDCEAECVRPALKPGDRLYVSGIGKVNAAAATQRAICEGATEIWNVGLAGGFGVTLEIAGLYRADRAVEYDFDLAAVNGTAIGVLNEYDTPYLELVPPPGALERPALAALPVLTLATGDRFNDSAADNALITETLHASLRDMEGAAIAHVCKRCGVPCVSVKCVSDIADRGSMPGQYQENMRRCLAHLTAAIPDLI